MSKVPIHCVALFIVSTTILNFFCEDILLIRSLFVGFKTIQGYWRNFVKTLFWILVLILYSSCLLRKEETRNPFVCSSLV